MDITLDSNVLVYAFVPPIHKNEVKRKEWENLHINARKIYENVIREKHCLILPFAVIMEIASVISLLTVTPHPLTHRNSLDYFTFLNNIG
ncbi:MAG: hypothetical protein MIO93_13235 [ANME-2 cluster archaeon]|jgi:predicted nucleic acid-binding protein|nr:hypothetical protein [ANME-2 cluster archaeon]